MPTAPTVTDDGTGTPGRCRGVYADDAFCLLEPKIRLNGTHHGVSAKHPQAYHSEFTFRFNRRFYPFNVCFGAEYGPIIELRPATVAKKPQASTTAGAKTTAPPVPPPGISVPHLLFMHNLRR
jgi:hypothetical protein